MDHETHSDKDGASDCERTRKLLHEFLDGELDEVVAVSISRHADACPPCGLRIRFEASFLRCVSRADRRDPVPGSVEERLALLLRKWREGAS